MQRSSVILSLLLILCSAVQTKAQVLRFADHTSTSGLFTQGEGHGVAVTDYDGDGWEDIYIAADQNGSALFRNNRDGTFTDVTQEAGVYAEGKAAHPLWGDLNNDGYPDLYVGMRSGKPPSKLFLNNGDGTFRDGSQGSGLDLIARVGSAAFGDYDNDGQVDLFIATRDGPDQLYRNIHQGDSLFFEDVTQEAGVEGHPASVAMQATWIDFDQDGDLDLFAVHDGSSFPNRLYRNNGYFPFIDVAQQANIAQVGSGNGMGVAWGDYDGDGWEDAYVTRINTASLYRSQGNGTFEDMADVTGALRNGMSWGVVATDFDNDADSDLFIVNTYSFDNTNPTFLYENTLGRFFDIAPVVGAAFRFDSFGAASGDFNNDGRQDLVMTNTNGQHKILLQNETDTGNWVRIKLAGTSVNRMAIGTRVRVVSGEDVQYRTVSGGNSYCSQSSPILHVGLSDASHIDTLDVYWKPGHVQRFTDLEVNTLYSITEGDAIQVDTERETVLPDNLSLDQNYPNPVQGHTTIRFSLPEPTPVQLTLHDPLGRLIHVVAEETYPAGIHQQSLNVGDLPNGVYFYRLRADQTVLTKKLSVIR